MPQLLRANYLSINCKTNYKLKTGHVGLLLSVGILIVKYCRPREFIQCNEPIDLDGNITEKEETGVGCVKVSLVYHIRTQLPVN